MEDMECIIRKSAYTTVANLYLEWRKNALTFEEFEEHMRATYFTLWDLIRTLENHGVIDEDTSTDLERYVFHLTRTY